MQIKWSSKKILFVFVGIIVSIYLINIVTYHKLSNQQLSAVGSPVALSSESKIGYDHIDAYKYCSELVESAEVSRDKDTSTIYSDWYLPTFKEIAEFKGQAGNSQNPLWTSSERGVYEWDAIVLPTGGWLHYRYRHSLAVRCVRDNDHEATDPSSISPLVSSLTYFEAKEHCEQLSVKPEFSINNNDVNIYDDWRLPTTAESYLFVGYKKSQVFDAWTDTKSVGSLIDSRNTVRYPDGSTKERSVNSFQGVQCVR